MELGADESYGQSPTLIMTAELGPDDPEVIPHYLHEEHVERIIQESVESRLRAHHIMATAVAEKLVPRNIPSGRVDKVMKLGYSNETQSPRVCGLRPGRFDSAMLVGGAVGGVIIAL